MFRRVAWMPALAALALAAPGCGSADDVGADAVSDADLPPPADTPPADGEAKADSAYLVTGLRSWYLVGNALTAGNDTLSLQVKAPSTAKTVDLWLDSGKGLRLKKQGTTFSASVDIKTLAAGRHTVKLAANGSRTAFQTLTIQRSHPLYVFVSNDWDDSDNADPMLRRQETLRQKHPQLKLTHFVGPYTFTDPALSAARRTQLVSWVKQQRDQFGDEIGLHIHPWCHFVRAAGVACRTQPSFAYDTGDTSGYTVVLASYTESEMAKLLAKADQLFQQNGLGKPTSFRAGGWTAEAHTFRALSTDGFLADSSAVNWEKLEEWRGQPGAILYRWNAEHWQDTGPTTQPYHPSTDDPMGKRAPTLNLLELPDNGALVDYVTAQEMIDVVKANFSGTALASPKVVSIGYHPPNFSDAYLARMDGALTYVDGLLAASDKGPVVYARGSDLAKVFPH